MAKKDDKNQVEETTEVTAGEETQTGGARGRGEAEAHAREGQAEGRESCGRGGAR